MSLKTCTPDLKRKEHRRFWIPFLITFVTWSLTVGSFNSLALAILKRLDLASGSFLQNAFVAAITEPWLTGVVPAVLVILFGSTAALFFTSTAVMGVLTTSLDVDPFVGIGLMFGIPIILSTLSHLEGYTGTYECYPYSENRFLAGGIGGYAFGIVELYARNTFYNSGEAAFDILFWKMPGFHVNQFGPVTLHVVTKTFIIGAIFMAWSGRWRDRMILAGVAVGSAIHWIWNTWLLEQGWFWSWLSSTLHGPHPGIVVLFPLAIPLVLEALRRWS